MAASVFTAIGSTQKLLWKADEEVQDPVMLQAWWPASRRTSCQTRWWRCRSSTTLRSGRTRSPQRGPCR